MRSPWRLEQRRAWLTTGPLEASVDLDQPSAGLDQLRVGGASLGSAQILGVELPIRRPAGEQLVDVYSRGSDLVVSYAELAAPALRWQVYWRAVGQRFPSALAAVEAIVSVETRGLDSRPELATRSTLPTSSWTCWRVSPDGNLQSAPSDATRGAKTIVTGQGWGCFSFDLPADAGSYVELVHPTDFYSASVEENLLRSGGSTPAPAVSLRHRLFGEQLEKGVILRSRIVGLFVGGRVHDRMINEFQRQLVAEALPLTT